MLYPQLNKCREVFSLNGIWKYKTVDEDFVPYSSIDEYMLMAVPASVNDIVTDSAIRDYVGKFLFETDFSFPVKKNKKYYLRIGATSHKCEVFLNGEFIGKGLNGYFPIDLELKELKDVNRLSIVIDNRLNFETLPVGKIENGKQIINHDFYNFTGIHRDVMIYSVPEKHIKDIEIKTVVNGCYNNISIKPSGNYEKIYFRVYNALNEIVTEGDNENLIIDNPVLWSIDNPYLYKLSAETESDIYYINFGIRKIEVRGNKIHLNDKPVYLKGFGMHEDFFVIGKGNSDAVNIRNFECMKWCNANSFRTSHYPYSEAIMDLADKYGFLVIDEVPAVGMNWWDVNFAENRINEKTKTLHKELIKQLYERDKNHPCVMMLSVANEPATNEEGAEVYFKDIFDYARTVWEVPLTVVEVCEPDETRVSKFADVICANRYNGWYAHHGDLSMIKPNIREFFERDYELFHKPIIITEFGADTVEGNHCLPAESFSEEYQYECIKQNCETFDEYDYCTGEHVWNFADFKTKQGLTRVRGNRKGVFTKERQPKFVAHYLKNRWDKR